MDSGILYINIGEYPEDYNIKERNVTMTLHVNRPLPILLMAGVATIGLLAASCKGNSRKQTVDIRKYDTYDALDQLQVYFGDLSKDSLEMEKAKKFLGEDRKTQDSVFAVYKENVARSKHNLNVAKNIKTYEEMKEAEAEYNKAVKNLNKAQEARYAIDRYYAVSEEMREFDTTGHYYMNNGMLYNYKKGVATNVNTGERYGIASFGELYPIELKPSE